MNKTLFVGTFLARKRGTKSVTEKINDLLRGKSDLFLVSFYENKVVRILDISFHVLFSRYSKIHIDVFSGTAFWIAEVATFFSRIGKKKIILTLHGGMLPEFANENRGRIERVFRCANHIQTPSLYLQAFFCNQGFNIHYLPNSIDLSIFPFNKDYSANNKLLWIRAFSPIYNPDLAIKTLIEIRKDYPNATLTMIGPDKGIQNEVHTLIEKMNLTDVVSMVGPVSNSVLYSYLHTHAVFLNTTSYESFGVAVMEAAACGIPVVSTPAGEIPLLWKDGEDMLITKDWSAKEMAKAVISLFEDKELIERLRINARKKAETFDWNHIKHQWLKLLQN